ncbi:hypothetical protein AVEN_226608-1 [Araneus ventricosus]|uniref:Uncharacterized protein n=1 Tax=Araneus ventricosus TaxID=182803 RepID=A0A4Y2PLK2_ARAVE|nr:hypothetical protein AVEN_226608-1 [Araneus ventricosus]
MFGSYYFCFVQFSLFPMPEGKRRVTGDAARRQVIRKCERRVAETDEERNHGTTWSGQKNKIIADCQTWHNVARREEPKKTEEQRNSRLVRQDVSRDLRE